MKHQGDEELEVDVLNRLQELVAILWCVCVCCCVYVCVSVCVCVRACVRGCKTFVCNSMDQHAHHALSRGCVRVAIISAHTHTRDATAHTHWLVVKS